MYDSLNEWLPNVMIYGSAGLLAWFIWCLHRPERKIGIKQRPASHPGVNRDHS